MGTRPAVGSDGSPGSEASAGADRSDGPDGSDRSDGSRESELERWQRNFAELLQELRVVQMGVQILFAFLLTLAFSGRVVDADTFVKTTYLVALLASAAATALLIGPVAHHRMLFRQGRKPELVRSAHRMAGGGLTLLFVAMVSSVLLASDLVLARSAAIVVAVATGVWFLVVWGVAPWALRRSADAEERASDPS